LLEELDGFFRSLEEDRWRWRLDEDGRFSVKSMYYKLEGAMLGV